MKTFSEALNKDISDKTSLNEEIYTNEKSMNLYKKFLYNKIKNL